MQVKVLGPCCWYASTGAAPLRVVLVRDPEGKWRDEALLATDLELSAAGVIVGYLRRWSVGLAFKVFKSEGRLEQMRSQRPERVLCELFGKLLALVVQQWVLLAAGYQMLRHSARRAARRVWRKARHLLRGLGCLEVLARAVAGLARVLQRRCRVRRGKVTPSTYDRLLAHDYEFREHYENAA